MRYFNPISAVCVTLISLAAARASLAQLPSVPAARENSYYGVRVVDDYQWLEESTNPAACSADFREFPTTKYTNDTKQNW